MFSLYLLHKYKPSRGEHKEEEKEYINMQYKKNALIMYTFEKERGERNASEVSL